MLKIHVLGVAFDACTKNEAIACVSKILEHKAPGAAKQIVTPNPEMLLEVQKNSAFQSVLNQAWLSIPDGIGILWASAAEDFSKRHPGLPRLFAALSGLCWHRIFPERVTGVDLMESICTESRKFKSRIFLLGGRPGIAEKTAKFLQIRYPGIHIVGTFSGSPSQSHFSQIEKEIIKAKPEVLFVAYGSPTQELWIHEHLPELSPVKIAMGVGGAFDFFAGERRRAPKWMQKNGLEWLYRLVQEPSRFKRIWNATVRFPWVFIKNL